MPLKLYNPDAINVQVIEGDPPSDQSALVAAQAAQIAELTAERDMAVAMAESAAESASVEHQKAEALQARIDAFRAALAGLTA